jgi:hypothetical protein
MFRAGKPLLLPKKDVGLIIQTPNFLKKVELAAKLLRLLPKRLDDLSLKRKDAGISVGIVPKWRCLSAPAGMLLLPLGGFCPHNLRIRFLPTFGCKDLYTSRMVQRRLAPITHAM